MKKHCLFLLLILVFCLACSLTACNVNEDPTTYNVTLECDCLDGCTVDLGAGSDKATTSITIEEGNTLHISIGIKEGWSADDLVVKLNDTVLTATQFDKDVRYSYDSITVTADSKVTVTGVAVKVFSVTLPTAAETPDGVVSVAIDQYLKKGAENSVAYNNQSILYGDSIRVKVVTDADKAMESFNMADNVYLAYKANGHEYSLAIVNDGVNNYFYINDIKDDLTMAFRDSSAMMNPNDIPDELPPRYVALSTDCAGTHCAIYPYSLETHAAEVSPNYELGAFAYGTDFCFIITDNSSSGYVDYSNVTFTLNGEPLAVSVETDSVNSKKYYRFTVTEDGKLGVVGLTVNTANLPNNAVVYCIDNTGLNANDINFQNKALFVDSRGRLVFYADAEDKLIDGSQDIYPNSADKITKLSFHVGTDGINYAVAPVVSFTAINKDNVTYPVIRNDPLDTNYQIIKYRVMKMSVGGVEKWFLKYSTTTPNGDTLLEENAVPLGIDASQPLYLSLICETTPSTATLNLKEATCDEQGNINTTETDLAVNSNVEISYDATKKVLTIENATSGYVVKVTNVLKENDDYKVMIGNYKVTTNKLINQDTQYTYVVRIRYPEPNSNAYVISISQDEWGRYVKEDGAYVSEMEAMTDEINLIISSAQ